MPLDSPEDMPALRQVLLLVAQMAERFDIATKFWNSETGCL